MKNKTLGIALIVLGIIYFIFLFLSRMKKRFLFESSEICYQRHCFDIQIADEDTERQQGLMFIEALGLDQGMLFIFPQEGEHTFWMKNTLIPLDIIRLDSNFKIIDIQYAIPCKVEVCDLYIPKQKSKYVLEINRGVSNELGIEIGDFLEIN